MSKIFRVVVESPGILLADVDVRGTVRIDRDVDILVEIFPTDQPVPRSALLEPHSMTI